MEGVESKGLGRYIIADCDTAEDRLSNLTWELDAQTRSVVKWAWPTRREIKIAIVFPLSEEDAGLDIAELLGRDAMHVICSKEIDKYYCKPRGTEQKICYKVYPAMFGEGNQIIVINQTKDNTTGFLFIKSKVGYSIKYKNIILSKYKKAELRIRGEHSDADTRAALEYERYSQDRCICRYPIVHRRTECYLRTDEEIRVMVKPEYSDQIALHEVKTK